MTRTIYTPDLPYWIEDMKEAEKRGYSRGYRAGVKKLDRQLKKNLNAWHKSEKNGLEK